MTTIPDQLTAIQAQITAIQQFTTTVTGAMQLLNNKIDAIATQVSSLKIPTPIPVSPDITALTAQVAALTQLLSPSTTQGA